LTNHTCGPQHARMTSCQLAHSRHSKPKLVAVSL
jgi:hypothetical protein